MKRTLLITIVVLGCFTLIAATNTFAAQQSITITATVSGVQGVSLSGTSWAIGSTNTGESRDSSTITATNTGSVPERLEMSAAATGDFTLGATAGTDQIAIWGKCASADPGLTSANALTGTPGQASANVNPAANLKAWMKYWTPTQITGTKSNGSATVTISTAPAA